MAEMVRLFALTNEEYYHFKDVVSKDDSDAAIYIEKRLNYLRESEKILLEAQMEILKVESLYSGELVIMGAINRSLALIDGFVTLMDKRNLLCATPLIRLQLDTAMRIHALRVAKDHHDVESALLGNSPLKAIKSYDGKPLNDKYLYESLSKDCPWVSDLYKRTSGLIHMSRDHVMSPITKMTHEGQGLRLSLQIGGTREWDNSLVLDAIESFIRATGLILDLSYLWLDEKRQREDEFEKNQK